MPLCLSVVSHRTSAGPFGWEALSDALVLGSMTSVASITGASTTPTRIKVRRDVSCALQSGDIAARQAAVKECLAAWV
jgi:hypothetical protein